MSNKLHEKNWQEFTLTGDPMYYLEFARNRGQLMTKGRNNENDKSTGTGN